MDVRRNVRLNVAVPAHQPNIEYAVRHLFGGDPKINPRLVAQVDVFVTDEQYRMLSDITHETLGRLRNGPAAVSIDHVVLAPAEPMTRAVAGQAREERAATFNVVETLTPGVWLVMTGFGTAHVREIPREASPFRGPYLALKLCDVPQARLPERWRNCTATDVGKRVVVIGEEAEVLHGVLTGVEMTRGSAFFRRDGQESGFSACSMKACFVIEDDVL